PMFLLLAACGAIYLMVGDMQEALMLLAFVFFVMGITLFQERKTERALEALRDLSIPRAMVIRDGAQQRIAGREVVRGDIILLAEGDRVPADVLVLDCTSLSTDESLLVFSGTLVVRGQGIARAIATGQQSACGRNTRFGNCPLR
ncbi:ATPase, partial [bacterium]|nr:ATPase [bacterium]